MSDQRIKITLSERRPITIERDAWPVVAAADAHDNRIESQAHTKWRIAVRQHRDGRRIVYGWAVAGPGGKPIGWRDVYGGFVLDAVDGAPDEAGTIRAIRRVAGILDRDDLGAECIADLPAEAL